MILFILCNCGVICCVLCDFSFVMLMWLKMLCRKCWLLCGCMLVILLDSWFIRFGCLVFCVISWLMCCVYGSGWWVWLCLMWSLMVNLCLIVNCLRIMVIGLYMWNCVCGWSLKCCCNSSNFGCCFRCVLIICWSRLDVCLWCVNFLMLKLWIFVVNWCWWWIIVVCCCIGCVCVCEFVWVKKDWWLKMLLGKCIDVMWLLLDVFDWCLMLYECL